MNRGCTPSVVGTRCCRLLFRDAWRTNPQRPASWIREHGTETDPVSHGVTCALSHHHLLFIHHPSCLTMLLSRPLSLTTFCRIPPNYPASRRSLWQPPWELWSIRPCSRSMQTSTSIRLQLDLLLATVFKLTLPVSYSLDTRELSLTLVLK